jgi:hypothetical protein
LFVPVDGFHGERGQADCDVFSAAVLWRGVADPLAGVGDDGLSGGDVEGSGCSVSAFVFDSQQSFQHDGEFVELGSLTGFEPALRAAHVGDAGGGRLGVDATDVLVDEFGLVAGGGDAGGLCDERGHGFGLRALGFRLPGSNS